MGRPIVSIPNRARVAASPRLACWTSTLAVLLVTGCGEPRTGAPAAGPVPDSGAVPAVAAPASDPAKGLAAFNRGAALLEQYEYAKAAAAFEEVLAAFPDWTAARFNLGLAILNLQAKDGTYALARAEKELLEAVAAEPENRWAHFCLGVYYQHTGENEKALEHYQVVRKQDPLDPFVAFKHSEVLVRLNRNEEAAEVLAPVVERDPGFVSGVFRLGNLYNRLKRRDEARDLLRRFQELNAKELAVGSYGVRDPYAAMGPYYMALTADGLPVPKEALAAAPRVVFSPDVREVGPALASWSWPGGEVKLPGLALGDLDGDGDQDVVLCGAGADGAVVVLTNDGKAGFAAGEPIATRGVAPALADVDNDGDLDLWLGRPGGLALLLNDGKGAFTAAPDPAPSPAGEATLAACVRAVDLDSDGDLDALAARWSGGTVPAAGAEKAAPSLALRNNLDGTFADQAEALGLAFPDRAISSLVADDFDNDRDIDLMLLPAGGSPIAWENFRVGKFRLHESKETGLDASATIAATTGDPFKTGRRDLLVSSGNRLALFRNAGNWSFARDTEFDAAHGWLGGTGAQFADVDNDGDLDIVVPDAHRADGSRGPALLLNDHPKARFVSASDADRGELLGAIDLGGDAAGVAADLDGDGALDLLLAAPGRPALFVRNETKGGHWLALDLLGKRLTDQTSRSPNTAIGARVELRAGTVSQQHVVGTPAGATAMPPLRVHAGLGPHPDVQWLRILWPDSILQAELELAADRVVPLDEVCRRTSSCPHLFAWDGRQFAFVSDFGGVGGLGYLAAPGVYAPPDPSEFVRLPMLRPKDGRYVVQVVEPLEEVVYFDEAKLIAVDHPEGTEVYPNEMAAVSAPPPPFELFVVRDPMEAVAAVDHRGNDVTDSLRRTDRTYPDDLERDRRFLGYAAPHHIDLDFGALPPVPADQRLILFLDGYVEYSTSTSNTAASQAGLCLGAPTISVERNGEWVELLREVGYPAGINHVMTVDLTGKLAPGDRRLRVATNMDISWDRAFLAPVPRDAAVRTSEAAPAADLHVLGYPREFSPDGRRPNLLDYANIDRSDTWLKMPGAYTRFGEVTELVAATDDRFTIMAPGDEITLSFPADAFGPVPPGHVRTFLLKAESYCKDMDLYTGAGDHLEPLPFHGMPSYPYAPGEGPAVHPSGKDSLDGRRYHTRIIGP